MDKFKPFAIAVAAKFAQMSKQELYRTDVEGDAVWLKYLESFPLGTNPIFRTRTEHDGSYDRSFIRKMGNVVAIAPNGEITTIWDAASLEEPYRTVAAQLSAFVRSAPIKSLFRTKEHKVGVVSNIELRDGVTIKWNHFHAVTDIKHRTPDVDAVVGMANTTVDVFRRGMDELKREAIDDILEMIQSKTLYRGEEFKPALLEYRGLMAKYDAAKTPAQREAVLWQNYDSRAARLRNTAIGTLVINLSEGMDTEAAVSAYEKMVAPTNYKRPTALITKAMVESATAKIQELGVEPALLRRHAKLSDISVGNVLWVNNQTQAKMKGGIESLLMAEVKQPKPDAASAVDITIESFMEHILPKAVGLELLLANKHRGNLMSLTAPVNPDAEPLFKWDNNFAWSYAGDIADSEMRQAVQARGGRVDGVFRFTHSWNHAKRNASLMDLHVLMPGNNTSPSGQNGTGNIHRVGWNHRHHTSSGGVQDVDYVQAAPVGYVPVENITFPDINRMPEGEYRCYVHNWQFRTPTEGGFRAEIEFDGQIYEYDYPQPLKNLQWVHVATVALRAGTFTIEHKLPSSASSQNLWGLSTEGFVKVNTVLNSPNHWDGNKTGNKHWFFILEDCKNPEPVRGLFNEYLRHELYEHRKVFEILGSKTKCEPASEQLSGLGFSSTKRDTVLAKVHTAESSRLYNINFGTSTNEHRESTATPVSLAVSGR